MIRAPRFNFYMPAWALLFLWPIYVLAFMVWLVVAALLLSIAVIGWTVQALIRVFSKERF